MNTLLNTKDVAIKNAYISVLVRDNQQGHILEGKGVSTVQVGDYTDTTAIAELASDYDGQPALNPNILHRTNSYSYYQWRLGL